MQKRLLYTEVNHIEMNRCSCNFCNFWYIAGLEIQFAL